MSLNKAYLIILASFVWLIGGIFVYGRVIAPPTGSSLAAVLFWGLWAGFSVIFLTGTAVWAGAKRYHPIVGIALGFIGPIGLLVLVLLPDRSLRPK